MALAALPWTQYTEAVVGLNHPTLSDTDNRALRALLLQSGYTVDAVPLPGLMGPVFNVKAFGALGNGAANDTAAIQAAIDAANGLGPVFFPAGNYQYNTLRYYTRSQLLGAGSAFPGSFVTLLNQISGTADVLLKPSDPTVATKYALIKDIGFYGGNNASNTGGVLAENADTCRFERLFVNGTKNFQYAVKSNGTGGGLGSSFNSFVGCVGEGGIAGSVGWLIDNGNVAGYCNGTRIIDCTHKTTSATFVKVQQTGSVAQDGAIVGCCAEGGVAITMLDLDGVAWKVSDNRFETAAGAITVTLNSPSTSGPTAYFLGNSWASPSTMVWTDNSTITSPRLDYFFGQANHLTVGGVIKGPIHQLSDAATIASDAALGDLFAVTLLASGHTIGVPTSPHIGQRITHTIIQDGVGGRTLLWNAIFKNAWSDAGNTLNKRSNISHLYDGANWNQDGAQTPYV
jgi:hypothetical protein